MNRQLFLLLAFSFVSNVAFASTLDQSGLNNEAQLSTSQMEITISPDGKNAYAADFNGDAIITYTRNTSTGALSFFQEIQDGSSGANGLNGVWGIEVSPDGKHVYVTADLDNAISVFSRNQSNGYLTIVQTLYRVADSVIGFELPQGIAISDDGNYLYAVATGSFTFDGAIAIFSRNSSTGVLTYLSSVLQGSGFNDGFEGATDIVLSTDNNFAYVTGQRGDSIAAFSRNPSTGALTYLESHFDGVSSINGLDLAYGLAISEDGENLYVGAHNDNAITHFRINASNGTLTFQQTYIDGVSGIDGLAGAVRPLIHESGYLFVTSRIDDSIAVFTRDSSSGALTFVEKITDGVSGVDGLDGANGIAQSPDGANIYVTAFNENKIATFGFAGCKNALSSSIKIKKKPTNPQSSSLVWKWKKGEATTMDDIGDPQTDSSFTIKVYDATGEKISVDVPRGVIYPSNPWSAVSGGYKFQEKTGQNDGAYKMLIKEGEEGRAKLQTLHKGENLTLPSSLAFVAPVTVRMVNNDPISPSACWQSTLQELRKSTNDLLIAR